MRMVANFVRVWLAVEDSHAAALLASQCIVFERLDTVTGKVGDAVESAPDVTLVAVEFVDKDFAWCWVSCLPHHDAGIMWRAFPIRAEVLNASERLINSSEPIEAIANNNIKIEV